ncbi:MAG: DUF3046 domain-containing protein [Propionibacteriaceae bacterium]|nr:DUF3046 domain-containing protein [Propionibacteriaceae bacterium]
MREHELWNRMTAVLGANYVRVWAEQVALPELGSRTVAEALAAGTECKLIWRAVVVALELDSKYR